MPDTTPLASDRDEVRVFLALPEKIRQLPDAETILADEDRAHIARYKFERDRHLAAASRALQRYALSRCSGIPPGEWRFAADDNGKPYITTPVGQTLSFSNANTRGLVGCAVGGHRPIGFDVEELRPMVPTGIVERCWSPIEKRALEACAPSALCTRFTQTWTLKEAYVKARGLGLAVDLRHVSVVFGSSLIELQLDPALEDSGDRWYVSAWMAGSSHAAAVCVRNDRTPVSVRVEWLPATVAASPR